MDWNGPNDPDNPRNFPFGTKLLGISSVTLLAFVSAFAGAIYAPAQEDVMKAMNCSSEVAMLPLSLNNLGMAFGPIVGAPLSEKYGRKTVYLATTPIFILFMVGAAVSQTISGLILCRFFGAIFGSPNISNASATILDYTYDTDRGSVLAVYYAIPTLAATVAPLAGGFVMIRTEDWRWTQWVPIILAGVLYCLAFFTKETYKAVILRRRAEQLGVKNSTSPEATAGKGVRHFIVVLFLRPVHMLFTEPIVFLVSLYNGLLFGLLYAFVTSISWVFAHYYGFGRTGQALSYLGVTLGNMIACLPQVLIDRFYFQPRLRAWKQTHGQDARMPPEARLVSAMIGSVLLPAALLILSWTANFRVHWMVPIIFQGLSMFSCLLIYTGAGLFMLDTYGPLYGASASGAMMFSRYFLSCAFPLFTLQMFEALRVGWASTLLALLTLLLAPIPWIFWVYGPRIRQASRYETTS
ncbi:MFS general substrate transporter [Aspergillus japonicus CBS 114.51]|uniref:MFS general substrate transporter n=1 Tax=Aspergillus japonicus CBS 114.51 TaxID=1448312 RepID=A0A8T8WM86_ASPJA|nr:MFS general substrate transporter [Aspergillus japonicus CBS 114.51]RAH76519.1 MFS general substrate transporter [Aspergillus japonicus CBS 114.51]